jgi:cytochrome b
MKSLRTLVYDAPTRLFHWLFAGLFVAAFSIATAAEHSAAFPLHMLAGMLLACLVVLRVIWGLVGTRHARFSSFALRPRDLYEYFRGLFTGSGRKWAGHNPASSWSALLMIALAAGLGVTGLLMTSGGDPERYEEIHEVLANSFLVVALAHVAGVLLHVLRYRDAFPRSMVDGRKAEVPEGTGIAGTRPLAALFLLILVAAAGTTLWNGYDPRASTLSVFGATLHLGESQEAEAMQAYSHGDREDDERDDHD